MATLGRFAARATTNTTSTLLRTDACHVRVLSKRRRTPEVFCFRARSSPRPSASFFVRAFASECDGFGNRHSSLRKRDSALLNTRKSRKSFASLSLPKPKLLSLRGKLPHRRERYVRFSRRSSLIRSDNRSSYKFAFHRSLRKP